jgi:hypothetical protein
MMKRLINYLFMLCIPFAFIGCFNSSGEGIKTSDEIIIKAKALDSYLHVVFTDAKTKESLRGKDVSLTVKGKDAQYVYNNLGIKENVYTTKAGFYDLTIDDSKSSGDFIIVVSREGYEDFIYHVRSGNGKFNIIEAKLIKNNDLPEGISVAAPKSFTTDNNGKITGEVKIDVNSLNSIRLTQGSVLKDASGKTLTGEISSKVMFYDPSKTSDIFPGGLNVEAINENGENQNIVFTSAGLFSIELTAGNTPVAVIEGDGIELTSILDPQMINPNTGKQVAEGDEIQLWSMDSESAVWKMEKTVEIKKNTGGQLYLSEKIKHLSLWNWDWYTNTCTYGTIIRWEGNAKGSMIKVTNTNPINYYSQTMTARVDENDPLQFMLVPQNTPAVLTFEGTCGSKLTFEPSTLNISDLCSGTYPVKVNYAQSTSTTYTLNVNMDIRVASNPNMKVYFYGWVYFYSTCDYSGQSYYLGDYGDGYHLSATITTGVDYYFDVSLSNAYGYGYVRIDESGNDLVISFSPEYAYSYNWWASSQIDIPKTTLTVPKPANKIVNISTRFDVSDEILNMLSYY